MRRLTITATLAAVLALAACGSPVPSEAAPEAAEASEPASPSPEPSPEPTEVPEGHAACAAFAESGDSSLMQRVPGALTGIGDALGGEQLDELLTIHRGLEATAEDAPADLAAALQRLDEPFQEVADVVEAGGGDLNMDTSHVMEDVTDVLELCNGYGYTLNAG